MPGTDDFPATAEIVRRHDPDRYFTALFAPPRHRPVLFALYAFNHELARAREAVREPMAALIRLQWWREVVEGARRRHEVAGPLGEALDEGWLHAADLAMMLDAREAEAEPVETRAAFTAYVEGTAGGVMAAAARALGMDGAEALRKPGAAYGVAGILRSAPLLARQGRTMLPEDLLRDAGLATSDLAQALSDQSGPPDRARMLGKPKAWSAIRSNSAGLRSKHDPSGFAMVKSALAHEARQWLAAAPAVPRPALAACLPLVFARRDLARPPLIVRDRPASDRLAVTWAALCGRI